MQDIKQPKQLYLLSTSNNKHVIDENNIISMQDIDTSELISLQFCIIVLHFPTDL